MEEYFGIQGLLPWLGFLEVVESDPWQCGADPGAKRHASNTCGNARDDGNFSLVIPYNYILQEATSVFPSLAGGLAHIDSPWLDW